MRFFAAINAYQLSAAMKAAIELDVFTAIDGGAQTAAAIARGTETAERGVRMLCDYLSVQGFLSKQGNSYSLSPDSSAFLSRKSRSFLGGGIEFLLNPKNREAFDHLTESVRRGGSALDHTSIEPENPMWITFARSMMPMMFPIAQSAAGTVPLPDDRDSKVLDIAASHGMFGIAFAQRHPRTHIVGLDWNNVVQVALDNAKQFGVAGRYSTIAGDAFTSELGSGYDLILLPNFLHHFDQATCETFLAKCGRALRSGGAVGIIEFVPNDDRITPPSSASFSLIMLASTPTGDAWTLAEYKQMLANAGFAPPEAYPLLPAEHLLVLSRRA
jgi:ubiquinone/menaquinone biosynthesis C-methylase UbiE